MNLLRICALALSTTCSCIAAAQVVSQIGPRAYEFWPDRAAAAAKHFSFALVKQPKNQRLTSKPSVRPRFGFTSDFRYSAEIQIPAGTDLYGTGEVAGPLRRNGKVTECWNTDAFNYKETDASLYQSHPWVLAVRKDGSSFGVLADTTYRCRIDLTKSILFAAQGPRFPIILIDGKSPQEVVKRLADLTGHMNLPPEWALGYHQCRWSYMSQEEALQIASEFRKRHIPCDTIWFDIDYMNGFRIFTFNPKTFPNPKALNDQLAKQGFHNVWMIDPGVKVDPNYPIYRSGKSKDVFVKTRAGTDFYGNVWPGKCVFPDFTRPATRAWWSDLYQPWLQKGITGVWNDMNEPSVFGVPTKTMPEVEDHRGGGEIAEGSHAKYHNVFGMLMARATYEGLKKANPDKRPFVLTRAGYIGYQRYAATWTGDNSSTWTDMRNAIPMVLNLGLSGQPFVGPDIPGFSDNGPQDPDERIEFFSRWWALGSMLPFSRGHSTKGAVRKEPWAFGPEVEEAAREALWRRYVLMPYMYTAFRESSLTGLPVARPLFFADSSDANLRNEDRGFMIGDDIAVAAQIAPGSHPVAVPKSWSSLPLDGKDANLPDLYIRPGSIVALGPPQQFIGQAELSPLWLVVCPDEKGQASGDLYEDAGDGYGYQKGDFLATTYKATFKGSLGTLEVQKTRGHRVRNKRAVIVCVVLDGRCVSISKGMDGQPISLVTPIRVKGISSHKGLGTFVAGPRYFRPN